MSDLPRESSSEDRVEITEKYSRWIRYTHWLNAPFLFIMIWSGILIYWANDEYVRMPQWLAQALFLDHRLSEGMGWHFAIMWFFTFNGIVYVTHLLFSGEWREIVPLKRSFRDALDVVKYDLKLIPTLPPQPGKLNGAQRISYTGALFLGAVAVVTGIAIYKPVQLQWLTELLGGYWAARFEHFVVMILLSLFIVVHLVQVFRAGWANLRGMIAGYDEVTAEEISKREANAANAAEAASRGGLR